MSGGNTELHDPVSVVIHRRIEWVDTDMAGRWHFATAFRLFEAAETALWEPLGGIQQAVDLPRVHVEADFRQPLHYRDRVEVEVRVEHIGRRSLTYAFQIRRDGTVCADGKVVVVATVKDGAPMFPDEFRTRLLTAGRQPPDFIPSREAF